MIVSLATALGSFLFQAGVSGVIGQIAYDKFAAVYSMRYHESIAHLYVRAFAEAVTTWEESLSHLVATGPKIEVDRASLERLLCTISIDIEAPSDYSEGTLVKELTTNISHYLLLPDANLTEADIEALSYGIIRHAADLLVEKVAQNEEAFRTAVLHEARLAKYDRSEILELLERIPVMIRLQIAGIDEKLNQMLARMARLEAILGRLDIIPERTFDTLGELRAICANSVEASIAATAKYHKHLYVPRTTADWEFQQFLKSTSSCFLIQGEAGVGKTNLMCHLASTTSQVYPVLFFRGTTQISGRLGFAKVISDEISALFERTVDPASMVRSLDTLVERENGVFVVFIDAINESRDIFALKESLGYAIQDIAGSRVKLCISCRDVEWHHFDDDVRINRHLYEPLRSMGRVVKGVLVEEFSEGEFDEAWLKYSSHYALQGDLNGKLRTICRHPLMLQFLCEAFNGRAIPQGIHRREIFDMYWQEKIVSRGGRHLEAAVYRIVDQLYERRTTELYETEVVSLIESACYQSLLSERVILYTYVDRGLDQNLVGFTYEAFFEYTLARHFRQMWKWGRTPPPDITGKLAELVVETDTFKNLQGVIQYLALFTEDPTTLADFMTLLITKGTQWQVFLCDLVTKLKQQQLTKEVVEAVANVAQASDPRVRWAVGNALGLISNKNHDLAKRLIIEFSWSQSWQHREVAAFAAGHDFRSCGAADNMLSRLANDINWRVRRAVGYALADLAALRNDTIDILFMWSESPNWRVRQAVAKSLYGGLRNTEQSVKLIHKLAEDANEEVRWLIVTDSVSVSWFPKTGHQVDSIIQQLVRDQSSLVRKQIATCIPSLYQFVGNRCDRFISALSMDSELNVRWELARSLGRMPSTPTTISALSTLIHDPSQDVSFAARFTRRIIGDTELVSSVIQVEELDKRIMEMREHVARSSHQIRIPEDAPDLFNSWKNDKYSNIMDVLSKETELVNTQDEVSQLLALFLRDEDEGLRWAIASIVPSYRQLEFGRKLQLLENLLADSHYWVRREAINSLRYWVVNQNAFATTGLVKLVSSKSNDPNPEVRYAVAEFLIAVGSNHQELGRFRDDEDEHVRALVSVYHG